MDRVCQQRPGSNRSGGFKTYIGAESSYLFKAKSLDIRTPASNPYAWGMAWGSQSISLNGGNLTRGSESPTQRTCVGSESRAISRNFTFLALNPGPAYRCYCLAFAVRMHQNEHQNPQVQKLCESSTCPRPKFPTPIPKQIQEVVLS